ncbi:hypothetical protein CPB84DRAFT_1675876 [Gymnopilus junonius]|uniref:GAR domain-containing protein n=1 Tax=Gymnopilus junonius TaxID=109634 RepID=A0A9P5NRQ9_GYMJU|nr:hypothetical protein CPB84DRAFT_1675876 [Gymnopilus junonius]
MTEISYAISDIQTRIFEIQELRHRSHSDSTDAGTTGTIDQALMNLDERLESVEKGMKTVNEALEPLLRTTSTPVVSEDGTPSVNAALLRKHATLVSEWESVQDESDVLREELKEDKWLTVFRTVTDQADGMMSSLEKAVTRCQEFIWQVHRRGAVSDDFQSNAAFHSSRIDRPPITYEVFTTLLDSYEAKKKHYMPATSKVLSIIDKGVRDRVTKNGETLRRHAESAQRWKNVRERITRTDAEMENVRKIFLNEDGGSEHDSNTSGTPSTKNGYLATPPSGSRMSRVSSTSTSISGSISPFRKFARKITGNKSSPSAPSSVSPLAVNKKSAAPLPDPIVSTSASRRQRVSVFGIGGSSGAPKTPERPSHKHSQSYTPDSSPHGQRVEKSEFNSSSVSRATAPYKQRWNSSTKVEPEDRNSTIKVTPRRPPSSSGYYGHSEDIPPVPPIATPYRRSLSRASMASSRPWSPITSSNSTTHSSSQFHNQSVPPSSLRIPPRAQTPSRAFAPGLPATLRTRPKTPSNIPAPRSLRSISGPSGAKSVGGWDDEDGVFNRSHSPAFSTSAFSNTSPGSHPPRPPSRSMIPVPSVHLHTPSRPSSSMSNFSRSESPTMRSFRASALRAQTPEHALRARAQQVSVFQGSVSRPRGSMNKLPPSSFRDGSTSRAPSRPGSRAGAYTPSMDQLPMHEYVPSNNLDPLDMEVASVVNSIAHGLLIERVDPPLRKSQIPKEGEEIKAQYAFSNALSRKIVTCRLTTLMRSGRTGGDAITKKVMCRVGGGWQDLSHYVLNRQAGLS